MNPKTKIAQIRISRADRERWQAAAGKSGLSLSEWIRRRCRGDSEIKVAAP